MDLEKILQVKHHHHYRWQQQQQWWQQLQQWQRAWALGIVSFFFLFSSKNYISIVQLWLARCSNDRNDRHHKIGPPWLPHHVTWQQQQQQPLQALPLQPPQPHQVHMPPQPSPPPPRQHQPTITEATTPMEGAQMTKIVVWALGIWCFFFCFLN